MPCSNCGKPVRPHYVCMACGVYQGKTVLTVQSTGGKKLRKREKQRAAEDASAEPAKEEAAAK